MSEMVSIKNLSVGYQKAIVKQFSIELKKGEIVAILGRNGSGKSTLLGGICGLNKVFGGEIAVDGVRTNGLSTKKRARHISYFTQRTPRMEGFLAEQVIEMGCYAGHDDLFSLKTQQKKQETVYRCATLLGIGSLLKRPCHELSEGQRAMVFLAKVFAQNTSLILLDEPDNNLDYENTNHFFNLCQTMIKEQEKSGIIVLHNPSLALNFCDRMLILKDSVTVCDCSVKDTSIDELQKALRTLYPNIVVGKDPHTALFYTVYQKSINS